MFIVPDVLFVSSIPELCFQELKDEAYRSLEKGDHLGDDIDVSLREEYVMDYPPKFTEWLRELIDLHFEHHTSKRGFYGINKDNLILNSIWVNRMLKGDVHKPHSHKRSLYSFVAYISVPEQEELDAGFCYMLPDVRGSVSIKSVDINHYSEKHILIFPSDMVHTVYPKVTDTVRISVSGNISVYV